MVVCVTDFGVSKMMTQEMSKAAGTPMYMSPEILNGGAYSFSADTYSFAFIVWEIFSRKLPYGEMIPWEITKHVVESAMRPEPLNDPMDVLTNRCWAQDPQQRPSFSAILAYLKALQSSLRLNGQAAFAEACMSQIGLLDKPVDLPVSPSPIDVDVSRALGGSFLGVAPQTKQAFSPREQQPSSSKSILSLLPLRKTGDVQNPRKSFGEKSRSRTSSSGVMDQPAMLSPGPTNRKPSDKGSISPKDNGMNL